MNPFWLFNLKIPSYRNYLKIRKFFKAINLVQEYTFTEGKSYFDIHVDKKGFWPFGRQECNIKVTLHHSFNSEANKLVGLDIISKQLDAILDPLIYNDLIDDFNAVYTPSDWVNKMAEHNKDVIVNYIKKNAKDSIENMLKEREVDPQSEEAKELVSEFVNSQRVSMYENTMHLFKNEESNIKSFIESDLLTKENKITELQGMISYFEEKEEFENCILLNKVLEQINNS